MRAMSTTKTGSKVIHILKPNPERNHVRVKVIASAIDRSIHEVLRGSTGGKISHSSIEEEDIMILGWQFSGTVDKCGEDVGDIKVGDAVFGHLKFDPKQRQGTFSEYIVIHCDEISIKPEGLSHRLAAAAVTEALSALLAVRDIGKQRKQKSVLIIGAAGGGGAVPKSTVGAVASAALGLFAVAIAKRTGAGHIAAICGKKDFQRIGEAGADVMIDNTAANPLNELKTSKYDIIFDTNRSFSFQECKRLLRSKGTFVSTIPSSGWLTGEIKRTFASKGCWFVEVRSNPNDLNFVGEWILSQEADVPIDSCFRIENLDGAIQRSQRQRNRGQIVIDVEGGWPSRTQ